MTDDQTETRQIPAIDNEGSPFVQDVVVPLGAMEGFEYYTRREYLSISALNSFARCPRKFFYGSGCGLQPGIPHNALVYGEGIHNAVPFVFRDEMDKALKAFDTVWSEDLADQKGRSRHRAMAALAHAAQTIKTNGYEILPPPSNSIQVSERVNDWEVGFGLHLGLRVPFIGRADGLVRNRFTGETYVLEVKTGSNFMGNFYKIPQAMEMAPQTRGMTLAMRMYDELQIKGALIMTLMTDKSKNDTEFVPITVHDWELDEFVQWARWKGSQLLACEDSGHFPKDFTGCNPYSCFGQPGFPCDYQPLCQQRSWTSMMDLYERQSVNQFKVQGSNQD